MSPSVWRSVSAHAGPGPTARVGTVFVLLVCAWLIAGVGSAEAAGCPNEAFRVGPSAPLAECRAYERVSPADKSGGNVTRILQVKVAPSGDAATFYSSAGFAGSPSVAQNADYLAKRGGLDWGTEALDPPQRNTGNALLLSTVASTPDLGLSLSASNRAIVPGATEGGSNLYLRDNLSGATSVLYTQQDKYLYDQSTGLNGGLFLGATPDWSHIIIRSAAEHPLTPDSPPSNYDYLYDLSGGRLHLLNYLPGEVPATEAVRTFSRNVPYAPVISPDGRRVFLDIGKQGVQGGAGVFIREDDARTIPLSVSEIDGETKAASLLFANRPGTQVYFRSNQPLIAGAPSESIYRYDVASESLALMTPETPAGTEPEEATNGNAGAGFVLGSTDDGSDVYFAATGALGDGARSAPFLSSNLYDLHDGQIRWLGPIEQLPPFWQTSPDGRYLAFSSFADVTGGKSTSANCPSLEPEYQNQAGQCLDIYVYDSVRDQMSCVTCKSGPTRHHSQLGGQNARELSIEQGTEYARAVAADGTVFFETASKLLPRDVNGVEDAYSYRAGVTELVSTGTDATPSFFSTATPDGRTALFITSQQLVPADTDNNADLYADRVGGGLASQYVTGAVAQCEGEGCRPPGPAPPSGLASGTAVAAAGICPELAARATKLGERATALGRKAKAVARGKGKAAKKRARRLRRKAATERRAARVARTGAKNCGGNR